MQVDAEAAVGSLVVGASDFDTMADFDMIDDFVERCNSVAVAEEVRIAWKIDGGRRTFEK